MPVVVGELVAKLEVDLRNFERKLAQATAQVEQSAQRMERSMSRAGAATQQLADEQRSLGDKVGNAAKVIGQTIAIHTTWEVATKKLNLSVSKVAASTGRMAVAVGTLNTTIATASAKVTSFTRVALIGLRAGLIGVAAVISAKLLISFGRFLDRLGAVGAAIAVTRQGFSNLATTIGETGDSLEVRLRRATLGTVDDFSLLRTGTFSLLTGVAQTGAQFEEMARVATILALAVGKDAAEGFEILTTGIARHSVILLKQLGIVVDATEAYKAYANQLSISVDALTANQRSQAFLNAVMRKAQENVKALGLDTDNLAVVNAQAAASAINLRQAFAREVAEAPELLSFKRALLSLTIELRSETQKAAPAFGLLADAFFGVANALLEAATSAATFEQAFGRILAQRLRGEAEAPELVERLPRLPRIPTPAPRGQPVIGPPAPLPLIAPPAPPDFAAIVAGMEEVGLSSVKMAEALELSFAEFDKLVLSLDSLGDESARIVAEFEKGIPKWDELGQSAANIKVRTDAAIVSSGEFATIMARVTTGVAEAVKEFQAGDLIVPELRAKLQLLGLTADEIAAKFQDLGIIVPDALSGVGDSISALSGEVARLSFAIGQQIIFGIIDGVKDAQDILKNVLKSIIATVIQIGIRAALRIGSPSLVTRELGRATGEGFAIGITDSIGTVQRAFAKFQAGIGGALNLMQPIMATVPAGSTQAAGTNITINADFSAIPRPTTPEAIAVDAGWQRVFAETLRQLQFGGFR